MKRIFATTLAATMLFTMVGCSQSEPTTSTDSNAGTEQSTTEEVTKIALLLPGKLGDKSIFDSAQRGMDEIKAKYGDKVEVTTVEMTDDSTKFAPTLYQFSDDGYDIIITGTWLIPDQLTEVAQQYKDITYISFDNAVDYENNDLENVYSITYKANEGAFLGGVASALVTESDLEFANDEAYIGFLGGDDSPGINDFLLGYIQGAQYVNEDIDVNVAYIGSFTDSAKAKEMALSQYKAGVDIAFNVAGPAGLGMVDAAYDADAYVLGVDSDQAMLFEEAQPEKAELIVTSAMKNIDDSLVRAVDMYFEGTLPVGTEESLGLKEGGVSLAKNKYYDEYLTDEQKQIVDEAEAKVLSGEIVVDSAYGKTAEEIDAVRSSVAK